MNVKNVSTSEHKILEYPGYNIHYYVSGNPNGQAIVLLHAAFADHRCFNRQLEFFGDNYRVITLDMLGHGLSQANKTSDKIDKTAYHIHKILEKEGISKTHIVGVSMGSLLAQYFALEYPECTLSVSILGGYDISADNKEVNKAQRTEGIKWIFRALFSMHLFRNYIAKVTVNNPELQPEIYEMATCFNRKSFMFISGMRNVVKLRENIIIACPLLIMVGDSDLELAKQMALKFLKSIPESKFKVIVNAGHFANMDQPEMFNSFLDEFIGKPK
jgi:pimeloyl-ACP methyl ester carboxylesterase